MPARKCVCKFVYVHARAGYWHVGLLTRRAIDTSGYWHVGLLTRWATDTSGY